MILNKIISAKKEEVAHLKQIRPLLEIKSAIHDLPPIRDFRSAIKGHVCAIIAEVKRRSPSKGILREDFNHIKIASIYEKYGAAAISVLTDQKFFGGNARYLADIKETVHLPLLRKDFIIDPYQIYETRSLIGDALILIAGILEKEQLREYIRLTEFLGLSALVEVHSKEDLDKALDSGANIIGINNRNLSTFSTELNTSFNLIPHIPVDKIIISHVFLIGEVLMRSENIGKKLSELLGKL
jgi:indole-3-glycerol phosphate synthase